MRIQFIYIKKFCLTTRVAEIFIKCRQIFINFNFFCCYDDFMCLFVILINYSCLLIKNFFLKKNFHFFWCYFVLFLDKTLKKFHNCQLILITAFNTHCKYLLILFSKWINNKRDKCECTLNLDLCGILFMQLWSKRVKTECCFLSHFWIIH